MACILGIISSDSQQRQLFVSRSSSMLAQRYQNQISSTIEIGECLILCTAPPGTPFSQSISEPKKAIILGEAWNKNDRKVTASDIATNKINISDMNGCYAAVAYHLDRSLDIVSDILGLFPIYYSEIGNDLVFSSQPTMVLNHPQFKADFSPAGLMGILLTMHPIGENTLYQNIKRLPAGHTLHWDNGKYGLIKSKQLIPTDSLFNASKEEIDNQLNARLDAIFNRYSNAPSCQILLSGGLDSRILAGYLGRQHISNIRAVTLGAPTDIEQWCARKVAAAQGWHHDILPIDFTQFSKHAIDQVSTEALSCGLNDVTWWQASDHIHGHGPLITGLYGDAVMGGSHIRWGYDTETNRYQFKTLFRNINRWGLIPDLIQRLVRPSSVLDAMHKSLSDLESYYDNLPGEPFQKSWLFDLTNRQRFHIGGVAHRLSQGAWASHPFMDSTFVELCAGISEQYILGRKLQTTLLCRRFPRLAQLPLDRNSLDTRPLLPSFGYRVQEKMKKLWRSPFSKMQLNIEQRYYYRVFDLNNPGWRSIRRAAEPYRERVEEIFDPKLLRNLIPPPDVDINLKDGIIDASGRKTILGLMLLMGTEFAPHLNYQ